MQRALQPHFKQQNFGYSLGTVLHYLSHITRYSIWGTTSKESKKKNKESHLKRLALLLYEIGVDNEDPLWEKIEFALEKSAPKGIYTVGDLDKIYNQILEEGRKN